ncbi:MAG: hypothetical protein ACK5O7_00085 [Holosporales bacterium]
MNKNNKNYIWFAFFPLILLTFSAQASSSYGGRLTCATFEQIYNGLGDGRASAFCQGAALACKALSFRDTLPKNSPLREETAFLMQQRDHALATCELGIFGYNPEYYLNNLERPAKKDTMKKP